MRISKRSEYALRALVAIARAPQDTLHQIGELSRLENIPVKFLEQILLGLRNAGILTSKRGARGGYGLARHPSHVAVGEVIQIMDGPLAPIPCAAENPIEECSCPNPDICPLRLLMTEVRKDLSNVLDNRTIQDVINLAPDTDLIEYQI